jgi:hypothetical protein
MAASDVLRNHWPAITIAVTAAAIACAAVVVLRSMPPRTIVMATGPAGGAYSEVGKLYRAALGDDVEVRLVQTAGSPENLALLLDPHSGRAASDQRSEGAAAPPTSVMNSRRFIRSPRRRGPAGSAGFQVSNQAAAVDWSCGLSDAKPPRTGKAATL